MSELGNRLKEARVAKGLTLEELQEITKIQVRYLVGIEEGNYSMMPGKFYVRAFIKQYAEAVDLSPEELFEEFEGEIPSPVNEEISQNLSRVNSRKTLDSKNSKVFDILPTILISLLVIGIIFLAWYLWNSKDSSSDPAENNATMNDSVYKKSDTLTEKEKEAEETDSSNEEEKIEEENTSLEEEPVVEEQPKQEITNVGTEGRTTTFELKNAEKFVVKLVATGKVWTDIQNGKNYSFFQGILESGQTETKEVDLSQEAEGLIIIGNSQVEIFINDQKLELGDSSSRQDIRIKYVKETTEQ